MARIVFEQSINEAPPKIAAALNTREGIAGWWTEETSVPGGEGSVMTVGFPSMAPMPFELRIDEATESHVRWTSIGQFPPHWMGTEITWTLTPDDGTTVVHFSHDGWASENELFANAAETWSQLMVSLKSFVETGTGKPLYRKE